MPDQDPVVTTGEGGYKESDDFVPNPTDQFGTVDTSGTAGAAHASIEDVTPIFEVARRQNLETAARALDPDDPDVHESLVTMPQGQNLVVIDPQEIKDGIVSKAEAAKEEPINLAAFRGPAAKQAQESGDEGATEAQAQQQNNPGGASGSPGGVDTARQQGSPAGATADGAAEAKAEQERTEAEARAAEEQAAAEKAEQERAAAEAKAEQERQRKAAAEAKRQRT